MFCRNTWCTTHHERTVEALYSSDDNECVVRSGTAVTSRLYSVSSSFAYGFFKTAHQAEKSLLSCRGELSDVAVTQRTGNCCWLLFNALVATTSARQRHDSRPMARAHQTLVFFSELTSSVVNFNCLTVRQAPGPAALVVILYYVHVRRCTVIACSNAHA